MAALFGIIGSARLGSARLGSARLGSALFVTLALLALLMLLAVPPAGAQTIVDYDDDDDGLIDITTPAQFNAVRHDLNGNGDATHNDYGTAFPDRDTNSATLMGCPSGTCAGYELRTDISLSGYANWSPLGAYTATFEGNGHAITNLTITTNTGDDVGLFSVIGGAGVVRRVAVTGASVVGTGSSSQELGILAGEVHGAVRFCYVTGTVTSATNGDWHKTGGMVGHLDGGGRIEASYSTATVNGPTTFGSNQLTGGLVGTIGQASPPSQSGTIRASYASGAVSGAGGIGGYIGGLAGFIRRGAIEYSYAYGSVGVSGTATNVGGLLGDRNADGAVTDSYYDSTTTGRSDTGRGTGQTTLQLQQETSYGTGIYQNWDTNVDGVSGNDDPWDFGTASQYPALKIDTDGDGTATAYEFGRQGRRNPNPPPPSPPPYNPAHDHPEIYHNPRHQMATACEVRTTGTGDDAVSTSTLTFDLGDYTRPITLALSLWDGTHFRSLQSQNIAMPELRQEGQTATVEVVTDPAQTRFRLDSEYGLNLVLGYADCHTDDPE